MKKYMSLILLMVGLFAGFAGGYFFKTYQQNKLRSNFRNGNMMGQRFVPNGAPTNGQNKGMMASGLDGEILSVDKDDEGNSKSITIKLSDGSTKIVLLSDSTQYQSMQSSKKENLKQGIKLSIFGKTNSDGTLTADRIQLTTTTK